MNIRRNLNFDLSSRAARRALVAGLTLGVLADLLLRAMPWGVNATLWALALVAAVVGVRAASGTQAPRLAAAVAALFGLVFLWRASPALLVFSGFAVLVAIAAMLLPRPSRSGVTAWVLAGLGGGVSAGVGPILAAPRASEGMPRQRSVLRPLGIAVLGFILAAPLLAVLSALFVSADPLFERTMRDIIRPIEDVIEHGFVIIVVGWLAAGALVATAVLKLAPETGVGAPRRVGGPVLVALALVALLFLAFLAVQARAMLGGHAFVESTLGLSYAEYARQGFFQLVACAAITLPALLAADWFVAPDTRERRAFIVIAGALVLMMAAVLASAARRLALYIGVYGLTEDRLYGSAFLVWLAITCVVFGATVLRGARERFMLGALAAAGIILAVLAFANPDGTIVRVNGSLDGPAPFDAPYAASLSADAVPALVEVLPRVDPAGTCRVAGKLLERWGSPVDDWRSWSIAQWRARRAVDGARAALEGCPAAPSLSRE